MSRRTVQTQLGLLLEEQSDQGLHCLPLHLLILSLSEICDMLNESCGRASLKLWGTIAFIFKLTVGQVEFSGLFLTLWCLGSNLPCYYGDVVGGQHDHTEEFCDQTDQPARDKQEKSISQNQSPKIYYSFV